MKNSLARILGIGGIILTSIFSPMKNIQAQDKAPIINGWFEATRGIKQGCNLRLYPTINIKGFKASSLADFNNFYAFSKNDLSHNKIALNLGKHLTLKPVATYHTASYGNSFTGDVNLTGFTDNYFGFFEVGVNPCDAKQPRYFTYHNFKTKIGKFGLFSSGNLRDIMSSYNEVEYTSPAIKNSGVSAYARVNFMKGVKPTYQFGASVNPRKFVDRVKNK